MDCERGMGIVLGRKNSSESRWSNQSNWSKHGLTTLSMANDMNSDGPMARTSRWAHLLRRRTPEWGSNLARKSNDEDLRLSWKSTDRWRKRPVRRWSHRNTRRLNQHAGTWSPTRHSTVRRVTRRNRQSGTREELQDRRDRVPLSPLGCRYQRPAYSRSLTSLDRARWGIAVVGSEGHWQPWFVSGAKRSPASVEGNQPGRCSPWQNGSRDDLR